VNPPDDLYTRWAQHLHKRHRPALEAQRIQRAAEQAAQTVDPAAVEVECTRLRAEVAAAASRLRAAVETTLAAARDGLAGARERAVGAALAEFPRLFPPGGELPSPARAANLLERAGSETPGARRGQIHEEVVRIAALVEAEQEVVTEVEALRAEQARLSAALAGVRKALAERHAVPEAVIVGVTAVHADTAFREVCARIAADAAREAGWVGTEDVLAPVRGTGGGE
jgi:hypothetical protein